MKELLKTSRKDDVRSSRMIGTGKLAKFSFWTVLHVGKGRQVLCLHQEGEKGHRFSAFAERFEKEERFSAITGDSEKDIGPMPALGKVKKEEFVSNSPPSWFSLGIFSVGLTPCVNENLHMDHIVEECFVGENHFGLIMRLQQGGEALTKKYSFFLFHPYTVMAENPSSFLRQRTATLPFSPLLGDGREPSSFLRQRTATIFLHPAENRNNLPSPGREPQQSSFTRQRTATIFLHPAEDRNFLFHHTPRLQQGGEALTKKYSFFLFHPYTVMAENPSSFLRQRTATLPFSPLLGDGREPSSFLRQRTATIFLHPAENRNNLPSPGREPQQSSFTRQRTATIFLHPAEDRNFLFHHTPSSRESSATECSATEAGLFAALFLASAAIKGLVVVGLIRLERELKDLLFRVIHGEIYGDIISIIQVGWLKWRNASDLFYDWKAPLKLKFKLKIDDRKIVQDD
ncbi:hypothetical protein M5K25_011109 [Dendrobium thyrsiflorum]|uniref:Uncharacterized protein n=1 Tax=Dendrobium thyrsiflorum TaxID=117978 RepID=A0ABD0V8Y1_DENTH